MKYEKKNLKLILYHFPTGFLYVSLTSAWLSYYSSKKRKEYLVLTCGPPSVSTSVPTGKGEDGESSSDDESSGDEENQTVSFQGTHFLISEIFCFRAFPAYYKFRDKYNSLACTEGDLWPHPWALFYGRGIPFSP